MRGAEATSGGTARQTFLAMAALMAPQTLNGIDIVDLLPLLGAADRPTVVAEAVWLGGRLIYTSEASQRLMKASHRVLAVALALDLDWKGLRDIHAALTNDLLKRASVVVWAPVNAVEPGVLFEGVGAIILLGAGDG